MILSMLVCGGVYFKFMIELQYAHILSFSDRSHQLNRGNAWVHSFQNNNYPNNGIIDAVIGRPMIS